MAKAVKPDSCPTPAAPNLSPKAQQIVEDINEQLRAKGEASINVQVLRNVALDIANTFCYEGWQARVSDAGYSFKIQVWR